MSAPGAAVAVTPPSADPFYVPPAGLAAVAPGTVLRSRSVPFEGVASLASSRAYQLLYRTTNATGQPIATVTTLLLPAAPASGPRRLVSYQTAEDSLTINCAPSYTLQTLSLSTVTAEAALIDTELAQGWDVVVPDHEGPQSEWAAGPLEGRATLDSIRATESFAPAGLEGTTTEVGMTGYSGGALATTWANALAPSYAPELRIVGVAAGGIPTDLDYALAHVEKPLFGAVIGVLVGINRAYPQLELGSLLNAAGKKLAQADASDADGCAGSVSNAPIGSASDYTNYPTTQALAAVPRVKALLGHTLNLIDGPVPKAPSYYYNAINDELARIAPVDQMVAAYCAHGATIDYYRDPVGEHGTALALDGPAALEYLKDRFAGKQPIPNTCSDASHPGTPSPRPGCPRASGRLRGNTLGLVALGMTRAQARRAYPHSADRGRRYENFFCLTPTGVRVGYASPKLLRTLPRPERKQMAGRVVWASTANRFYSLRGIRPGAPFAAARKKLRTGAPFHVGLNFWYFARNGRSAGVLKVRHGVVQEIGIADRQLTNGRHAQHVFVTSFS